jgi:hypothetical protein
MGHFNLGRFFANVLARAGDKLEDSGHIFIIDNISSICPTPPIIIRLTPTGRGLVDI